jgi:hypothetical protein
MCCGAWTCRRSISGRVKKLVGSSLVGGRLNLSPTHGLSKSPVTMSSSSIATANAWRNRLSACVFVCQDIGFAADFFAFRGRPRPWVFSSFIRFIHRFTSFFVIETSGQSMKSAMSTCVQRQRSSLIARLPSISRLSRKSLPQPRRVTPPVERPPSAETSSSAA